jgi:hypothetical protein
VAKVLPWVQGQCGRGRMIIPLPRLWGYLYQWWDNREEARAPLDTSVPLYS